MKSSAEPWPLNKTRPLCGHIRYICTYVHVRTDSLVSAGCGHGRYLVGLRIFCASVPNPTALFGGLVLGAVVYRMVVQYTPYTLQLAKTLGTIPLRETMPS